MFEAVKKASKIALEGAVEKRNKKSGVDRSLLSIIAEVLEEEYRDKEALNYLRWFGWPYLGAKQHIWDFKMYEWWTYHDPMECRPYFDVYNGSAVNPLALKTHRVPTDATYNFIMNNRHYWNPYKGIYVYARIKGDNNIAYVQKVFGLTSPYANSRFARIWWEQNIRIRAQLWDSINFQTLYPLDTNWHDVEIVTFGDRTAIFFDGSLSVYLNDPAYRIFYPATISLNATITANSEAEADSYLYVNKLVVTEWHESYYRYSTKPVAIGTTDTTVFKWHYAKVRSLIFINPTAAAINFTVKDVDGNTYVQKGVAAGDTIVMDMDDVLMNQVIAVADAAGGYVTALIDL